MTLISLSNLYLSSYTYIYIYIYKEHWYFGEPLVSLASNLPPPHTFCILCHFCSKHTTITMVTSNEKYEGISGLYFFVHPEIGNLASFCSVHNMWKVEWRHMFQELGQDFLRTAMLMRANAFTEKVVHPCAVRDDSGELHCVVMLGPFQAEEMERLEKKRATENYPFTKYTTYT